jgi:hypothetical protein
MSMVAVSHDKETYSEHDLKRHGAYAYARHPSTDCLLTSGLVTGETKVRRWRPGWKYPYADIHPDDLVITAWNSQFERLIWREIMVPVYGWPQLELEQFVCTSAHARIAAAGPAKLDIAGKFFNRRHQKDNKGHLLMLKMCRPASEKEQAAWMHSLRDDIGHNVSYAAAEEAAKRCHHTAANIEALHAYCDKDVWTESDIGKALPEWRAEDLEDFWANERINDQGIVVDRDFALAATDYAEDEKAYFAERIRTLTRGAVETPRQFQRIKAWAMPLLSDEARATIKHYEDGEEKFSFDADGRANLLAEASSDLDWIAHDPDFVEPGTEHGLCDAELLVEFIELLDAAGKSTISKYQAIVDRAIQDEDGNWRVHGAYVFAGASQSGRFSSTGIQVHNLVRDVPKLAKPLISAFKRGDDAVILPLVKEWAEGTKKARAEPVHALGQLVRPTFTGCPNDGFDLLWGDWSAIEACALPWLSLHPAAEDRLSLLRRGEDIYLKTASGILGRKITKDDKDDRQAFGKVPELSLGYLGGAGAFKAMAKNYGVRLPEKQIHGIVKSWREDNPWAIEFGEGCVTAAMAALRRKDGASFSSGRLEYWYEPDALDGIGALFCRLPSGRAIPYPGARIQTVVPKWGGTMQAITAMKSAWHPKKGEPWENWPRVALWKGLLIENCIAHGTEVLTNKGWTAIQYVQADDLLWDGEEWVPHSGLARQGVQTCMSQYGVWMTPEHRVLTNDGWHSAAEAQRRGHDRQAVRLPDSTSAGPHSRQRGVLGLPVRLWCGDGEKRAGCASWLNHILRMYAQSVVGGDATYARHEQASCLRGMAFDVGSLHTAFTSGMAQLRRTRDYGVRALETVREFLVGHGSDLRARAIVGPSPERLRIHAGQLPMGYRAGAGQQQAAESYCTHTGRRNDRGTGQPGFWCEGEHYLVPTGKRLAGRGGGAYACGLQEFQTYDLLNAGPRRRFAVRGVDGPVIVHNCTQAICADLLRLGMRRCEDAGLTLCAHTHDELMVETKDPDRDAPVLHSLMTKAPHWPGGKLLPLRAEVEFGYRYKVPFPKEKEKAA